MIKTLALALLAMLDDPRWVVRERADKVLQKCYPASVVVFAYGANAASPEVARRCERLCIRLRDDYVAVSFVILLHTDCALPPWLDGIGDDQTTNLRAFLDGRNIRVDPWWPGPDGLNCRPDWRRGVESARQCRAWRMPK